MTHLNRAIDEAMAKCNFPKRKEVILKHDLKDRIYKYMPFIFKEMENEEIEKMNLEHRMKVENYRKNLYGTPNQNIPKINTPMKTQSTKPTQRRTSKVWTKKSNIPTNNLTTAEDLVAEYINNEVNDGKKFNTPDLGKYLLKKHPDIIIPGNKKSELGKLKVKNFASNTLKNFKEKGYLEQ